MNPQDILKHSNIQIIEVPEGEEEELKIENLFEPNYRGARRRRGRTKN